MKNLSNEIQELTPLQRSFLVIEQLQSKLDKYERYSKEPIAIIGMGCRFPGGADNPESFWTLLSQGIDAISEIPSERWNIEQYYDPNPETPGKMYTRYGGFVGQLQEFDSHFFNIAPIEAISLDPQQRLLLEVSWEALEHGAYAPQQLAKTQTGVFLGICSNDYLQRLTSRDLTEIDAYLAQGNAHSTATGRLSHFLGLTGPSIAVDTACSSSLVSLHLACASLRNRECNLALAGGVNRIISPEYSINFSRARMLSVDGRCKTFDAGADGFVRGEGCGVVVLKRFSDAVADGDNILAVIRGTAINQDGHTSGLTVPNGPSQESVIRQALTNSGVKPEQVSYIEAHGTGTSLGDPIEVTALGNVFGESHSSQQPLIIGSLKTNIGHLEAAAGIAGLIKVVLQLQHQQIAPHLHFDQPNPYINWKQLPVLVPTHGTPWQIEDKPRLAGLSSFGFSGTNAHVILEEAPSSVHTEHLSDPSRERRVHLFTLSTKNDLALWELVQKYQEFLEKNGTANLADICFTANTGRCHFQHRLAIIASNQEDLAEKLAKARTTEDISAVFTGIIPKSNSSPKMAFLFTGQGSQYVNMGRQLYETEPIFRQALDQCHQILQSYLEKPLKEVIYPQQPQDLKTSEINQTAYTQPALFAIEYALFKLWQSWGINPDVVMGHSVGEYVAATVAGVFSLEDGLKLIATRGRLMQQLPCEGEMVSVMTSESKVRDFLKTYTEKVALAAINGPESVVISGETEAIEAIISNLESEGIKTKRLQVSHPFHSPLMAPMLAEFEAVAHQITYHQPEIPLISNITGLRADKTIATAKYWVNHVLEPVRFAQSMETLHQKGYEIFLEIGPKPILLGMGRQCLPEQVGVWLPSLREGVDQWQQMLSSLGQLYVQGAKVDWFGFDRQYSREKVVLPTYPFQRERYWIESNKSNRKKPYLSTENILHPLLGKRFYCAGQPQQLQFESLLAEDEPAYLKQHRVFGLALLPTTAYLEIALAAGANRFKTDNLVVEDLAIQTGLILPEGEIISVQTILTPSENQTYQWQVFTQQQQPNQDQPQWILHANGKIRAAEMDNGVATVDLENYLTECSQAIEIPDHYQHYRQIGIEYGSSFQGIQQLWKGSNQAIGKIELSPDLLPEATDYHFHPALLDGALQVLIHALPQTNTNQTYLPVGIEQLNVYSRPGRSLWAIASVTIESQENWTAQLTLVNGKGEILATLFGLRVKLANPESLLGTEAQSISNYLYEVQWRPQARFGRLLPPTYLPSLVEISQKLKPTLSQVSSQTDNDNYGQLIAELEDLSVEFVLQAFREMGWSYPVGKNFSGLEGIQHLRIVPSHHRLFSRLLEMLKQVGILKKNQDQWQVQQQLGQTNLKEKTKTLLSQYPQAQAELTLLNRCASQLSAVLRGAIDPVQLVFPEGDLTTATQLYQNSPGAKVMNSLVEKAIATALEKLPPQRGVRLLELGAGTGGTTSYILPHLPPDQSEYVFTDIGALFTAKAQEKFRDYPFVTYQTLDIEQDPTTQGFIAHQYDIIIAANVLHATTSLEQTLSHVRQLLAPGGILLLLEGTTRQGWLDLIFGLLEGWWKFRDFEIRPDYPLLSASQWQKLLTRSGFSLVVTVPESQGSNDVLSQQALMVAQAEPTLTAAPQPQSDSRNWLILADIEQVAQHLAHQLRAQGERCTLVYAGETYQQVTDYEFRINPHQLQDYQQLLQLLTADSTTLDGVIQCWSLEVGDKNYLSGEELERLSQIGCGSTLSLVQALVKADLSQPPRLWIVTQGAQPVPPKNPVVSGVAQSSVWGMGKVISLEHPELNCVRIDLDPNQSLLEKAEALWAEIWSESIEDQVALREDSRYVPRLIPSRQDQGAEKQLLKIPLNFPEDGTYLITGGLGGLGLVMARWMVERGAKHLVLVGRSSPKEFAQNQLTELKEAGANLVVEKADVSSLEQMARVVTKIEQSLPPLTGVIHCAAVLEDGVLQQQNWSNFTKVMKPKVQGAWHLHQLTQNQPLDFFILFSSIASLFGSPGQSNYAAANAFLDGLAYYRRTIGLPGLSINWGTVSQVAEAAERGADTRVRQKGINPISPSQVLEALDLLISSSAVEVGVVPIEWNQFLTQLPNGVKLPFLEGFTAIQKSATEVKQDKILSQLELASKTERETILSSHLQSEIATVLGMGDMTIDLQQPLTTMGLDSLMALELRNRVKRKLGVDIPIVQLVEGMSIADLGTEINQQLTLKNNSIHKKSERELAAPEDLSQAERKNTPQAKIESPTTISEPSDSPSDLFPCLIPIQPEGNKSPFFCLPPVAGVVFPYFDLASLLGKDRPFYGIQSLGFMENEKLLTSIQEMASYYIKAIKTVQPHGPYYLGGWSLGVVIAFEMARQLEEIGEVTERLILIDLPPTSTSQLTKLYVGFKFLLTQALPQIWPYVYDYVQLQNQANVRVLAQDALPSIQSANKSQTLGKVLNRINSLIRSSRPLLRVMQGNTQALVRYTPKHYTGKITLLRTSKAWNSNPQDPTLGWSQFSAQEVETHLIPGHHLNLLRQPHVNVLAQTLKNLLK
ncbi:SDR family NAD(P)-dependent oxidoreductase [Moorena producens]|uniref:SDR family NAD(P)-dependent oxidoreductase n=1 Tax=Moorena producens TaxID=1155739 RepID=UPI003C74180C